MTSVAEFQRAEVTCCRFLLIISCGDTILLQFVFFEKATGFDEISILLLTNEFVFFVSRYSFEHQSGCLGTLFTEINQIKVALF